MIKTGIKRVIVYPNIDNLSTQLQKLISLEYRAATGGRPYNIFDYYAGRFRHIRHCIRIFYNVVGVDPCAYPFCFNQALDMIMPFVLGSILIIPIN